jgi:hypothetical protein
MITKIIDLLKEDNFHSISDRVDTAKGKYKIPYTWKSLWNLLRRL